MAVGGHEFYRIVNRTRRFAAMEPCWQEFYTSKAPLWKRLWRLWTQ
jgi:hypothetical protein